MTKIRDVQKPFFFERWLSFWVFISVRGLSLSGFFVGWGTAIALNPILGLVLGWIPACFLRVIGGAAGLALGLALAWLFLPLSGAVAAMLVYEQLDGGGLITTPLEAMGMGFHLGFLLVALPMIATIAAHRDSSARMRIEKALPHFRQWSRHPLTIRNATDWLQFLADLKGAGETRKIAQSIRCWSDADEAAWALAATESGPQLNS